MSDRQHAYDMVWQTVYGATAKTPDSRVVSERHVRTTLCSHGDIEPEQFEKAVRALEEQGKVIFRSGFLTPVLDEIWLREAIQEVVTRTQNPKPFVAACNRELDA